MGHEISRPLPGAAPPDENGGVDADVDDDDEAGQHPGRRGRQRGRVEHRNDVVLDEAASVSRLSAATPELVFERSQRAYPLRDLDGRSVDGAGQVDPCRPGPAQGEQAAEQHEDDERGVDDDDGIG